MTRDLIELRATEIQVRMVTGDDGRPKVRGYGLVYNSRSEIMTEPDETGQPRKFRELIKPGAARKSLAEADLRVLAHTALLDNLEIQWGGP